MLAAVDDAQIELGLFRGCLAYNKINHLLRTCPPYLLRGAIRSFDGHFREMLATILRVPCLGDDTWELASLPTRFAGLGVTQTKTVAGAAFIRSCADAQARRRYAEARPGCVRAWRGRRASCC